MQNWSSVILNLQTYFKPSLVLVSVYLVPRREEPGEFFTARDQDAKFVLSTICKNATVSQPRMVRNGMWSVTLHAIVWMWFIFWNAIFAMLKQNWGRLMICEKEPTTIELDVGRVSPLIFSIIMFLDAPRPRDLHPQNPIFVYMSWWHAVITTNYWT